MWDGRGTKELGVVEAMWDGRSYVGCEIQEGMGYTIYIRHRNSRKGSGHLKAMWDGKFN
jgi:hypothetical protein